MQGMKGSVSAKDCFEKIKNQIQNPKHRRFESVCREYADDLSQENALIREFICILSSCLKDQVTFSGKSKRTDIFIGNYEMKHRQMVKSAVSLAQDVVKGEKSFFLAYLNGRPFSDLLSPSKDAIERREGLDRLSHKLHQDEARAAILGRQIETFREWTQTSEYKRCIDDYNYLSKRIYRENKHKMTPHVR